MCMVGERMPQTTEPISPKLNRLLLLIATLEGTLLLASIVWLGYIHLVLAELVQPVLAWAVRLAGIVVISAAVWRFYRFARRRRFRFSLRTLLVATCVLSALLAVAGNYLTQRQQQQSAERAVSHIQSRNGVITVGSPTDASAEARKDWTDLRNATSVSFTGIILDETDFAQLAKIPNLVAITIKDSPICEDGFSLLQRLPNLTFLTFENTGASDATLRKIEDTCPNWHVFQSYDEAKQWSMARVKN